ncbi:ABC transporter substrate-binding protein [Teichococcus aestuarii]|uniref:ABC transporter substrate-binding protein n=1 Tax=Teichococcus aestuarii TaxID=568898 RepID=UPI00360D46C0
MEGRADQLIERIRNEGANSPADVFLTVDAARLARAAQAGILAPHGSAVINERVPAGLRDPQGLWFAFSQRARLIMYDREKGRPEGLNRYEDLADPRFKGMLCTRSGAHPYNTSLGASVLMADGPQKTEEWARGVVANLARPRRAATATSSAPSPPASAASPSPTATISASTAAPTSRRTRRCSSASASSSPTRGRATAARM